MKLKKACKQAVGTCKTAEVNLLMMNRLLRLNLNLNLNFIANKQAEVNLPTMNLGSDDDKVTKKFVMR